MKEYATANIRNVAVVGHGGDGKTTLTEAMLFSAGAIDRIGKVEDGNTVSDFDPEEIKRTISISASLAPYEWKETKINAIDVPGYFDFVGEMVGALEVADGALIVVSALAGLEVGAEKAWDACKARNLSRMFVINQVDRENADVDKVFSQLQDKYGAMVVPLQLPIMSGMQFKGVVNLLDMSAVEFGGKQAKSVDIPAALMDRAQELREALMEAAAGCDDELMEAYFEAGELDAAQIAKGLRIGVADGSIVPAACTAATLNLGVAQLMDLIAAFMPSPLDRPAVEVTDVKSGERIELKCDANGPLCARVFKTVADPFVGRLSLFKLYSGQLSGDTVFLNANSEKTAKASSLYMMRGKKQTPVTKLVAGDIGALAKLQNTMTGNTLCDPAKPILFDDIKFPEPCISLAVSPKKSGDEDKVFGGLNRLAEEDPTFTISKQVETNDMLLSGVGELHIEVICRKLQNKFGAEAQLSDPKVPYRETIRKAVKAEGRHKKQTGGHGQFGHCWIEFQPKLAESEEFEFIDRVVGGVVPRQFIPAVEKGLRESISRGVLAGYPIVGLRAILYDGSYHSVDSSEMAFKTAARLALRKGLPQADPALLEPIYQIEVLVPDDYMGDIIGDLNRRRGRILGMGQVDGLSQVTAEVPLAEVFKYATDLRSMTQARGAFKMAFQRYEEVPGHMSAKIIAQAKVQEEEED